MSETCKTCGAVEGAELDLLDQITTLTRERDEARWAHRDAREDYERLCKERDEARSKVRRLLHVIHGMAEAAGMPEPALAPEGEILRGIQHLRTEAARLRGALEALSTAERHYRDMYQRHGGQALDTGRAWDILRKAGIEARAALAGEGVEKDASACTYCADKGPSCRERFAGQGMPWICTRPAGHAGDHVACGETHARHTWSQAEKARQA